MTKSTSGIANLRKLETVVNSMYPEREAYVRALVLSILAGKHLFVLGPPGTAKTEIADLVFSRIKEVSIFSQLMMKTTTADELFGAYSLPEIKKGRFARVTAGSLVESHFAFLDEIWKGSSTTMNGMLTLMSQQKYTESGNEYPSPLRTVVGASNELPGEDLLQALYDRFSLRIFVDDLKDDEKVAGVLFGQRRSLKPSALNVTLGDLDAARTAIEAVKISDEIAEKIMIIRQALITGGFSCSVRRLNSLVSRNGASIIKANAFFEGRTEVNESDLIWIADGIWEKPSERQPVRRIVRALVASDVDRARASLDELIEEYQLLASASVLPETVALILEKAKAIKQSLSSINVSGGLAEDVTLALSQLRPVLRDLTQRALGGATAGALI